MGQVFKEAYTTITNFLVHALEMMSDSEIDSFIDILLKTYKEGRKVLIIGAGRSGLVGKAFAMRLMHLGFNVYVLGETIVPALNNNDLVIAISGSGRTKLVVTAAEAAKNLSLIHI